MEEDEEESSEEDQLSLTRDSEGGWRLREHDDDWQVLSGKACLLLPRPRHHCRAF